MTSFHIDLRFIERIINQSESKRKQSLWNRATPFPSGSKGQRLTVKLTGKRPSFSWRSSTSFTSTYVFVFVGVYQAPASVPRPGRQGRTLLANCRHSGHVNSPLSTEKPWRTWSFWGKKKKKTWKFNLTYTKNKNQNMKEETDTL